MAGGFRAEIDQESITYNVLDNRDIGREGTDENHQSGSSNIRAWDRDINASVVHVRGPRGGAIQRQIVRQPVLKVETRGLEIAVER